MVYFSRYLNRIVFDPTDQFLVAAFVASILERTPLKNIQTMIFHKKGKLKNYGTT
jgi:hypothetical protein